MPPVFNDADPLERYGHNLTRLAQQGAFSPLAGQDPVVARVFQVLQRKRKCNPMILASDETRRWAIVAEVVRRMMIGEAADPFPKQQVIALDYEALFTNLSDDILLRQKRKEQMSAFWSEQLTQLKQESDEEWFARVKEIPLLPSLEEYIAPTMAIERLQSMFIAMHQASGSFVLFVDHFHRLLGGESERYPLYAFSLLKPALHRHQIQLIGACTLEQYRFYVEGDSSIHSMCQEICLPKA
jgi:ATP-dependent Clp protease ATP-binding subunit ClpB